jgi:hypothetical protein
MYFREKIKNLPIKFQSNHLSLYLSKISVGRARASFRQSFRFGPIGIKDRGHRLAGYLTPPSDVTQEEEEAASEKAVVPCDTSSDKVSQATVMKIEPQWDNNSAPALHLIRSREVENLNINEPTTTKTEETKISSTNKVWSILNFV